MILPALSTRIPGGSLAAPLLVYTRAFPGTLAAWNAAFPTVPAPVGLWPMQDAALPAVDTIGGINLATYNASGDEYAQQTGDPFGRYGVYLEDIASHIRAASTASLDQTTGSFSALFRFASRGLTPSGGEFFMRKKSSSTNTTGWSTGVNGLGNVSANLDSAAAPNVTATVALNFFDALYHDVLAVFDRSGGAINLYTDLGNASADISAHAGASLTNTQIFGFGDTQGNLNACARVQYSYAAFFTYAVSAAQWAKIRAGG